MRENSDLRAALGDLVREKSPDTGLVVRRVTRRGARRADAILQALLAGQADGVGERLDDPVTGRSYWMYGISAYGGDDPYGP